MQQDAVYPFKPLKLLESSETLQRQLDNETLNALVKVKEKSSRVFPETLRVRSGAIRATSTSIKKSYVEPCRSSHAVFIRELRGSLRMLHVDSLDFQVQRRLHDTHVLFTDRIHDVHVRQSRFGIVGLAEHRGSYSEAAREHPKQAKGRYRVPSKLMPMRVQTLSPFLPTI